MSSSKPRLRHRTMRCAGVLAIAVTGVVWSGCGDSTQDKVNSAFDNANEQAKSIQYNVQYQVDKALKDTDAKDKADKALQSAQDQADKIKKQVQDQIDQATGN